MCCYWYTCQQTSKGPGLIEGLHPSCKLNTQPFVGITFKCEVCAADGMGYQHAAVVTLVHLAELRLELPEACQGLARLAVACRCHLTVIFLGDTSEHSYAPFVMLGGIDFDNYEKFTAWNMPA